MKTRFLTLILTALTLCLASRLTAQVTVDFEDVGASLAPDSAFRGEDGAGEFTSGGVTFNNQFNSEFDFFLDNAYSNQTSFESGNAIEFAQGNATVLLQNADGSPDIGFDGSATWGVVTGTTARQTAPAGLGFQSLQLHNTQTAGEVIANGNSFARPFNSTDVFSVRINALDDTTFDVLGSITEPLTIDGITRQGWFEVDFAGTAVEGASVIGFEFLSTDTGAFGINTPAFVAIDNIQLDAVGVPEPSSLVILSLGALTTLRRRRKS